GTEEAFEVIMAAVELPAPDLEPGLPDGALAGELEEPLAHVRGQVELDLRPAVLSRRALAHYGLPVAAILAAHTYVGHAGREVGLFDVAPLPQFGQRPRDQETTLNLGFGLVFHSIMIPVPAAAGLAPAGSVARAAPPRHLVPCTPRRYLFSVRLGGG